MLMSAVAVGLNVFAQEKSEAVARFEANVEAFDGDVTKAEPSAEDLAAYEKLVAEYKALSNSDRKASMSLFRCILSPCRDERAPNLHQEPSRKFRL